MNGRITASIPIAPAAGSAGAAARRPTRRSLVTALRRELWWGLSGWTVASLLVATLVLVPLATVLFGALGPAGETWRHMADTVLGTYIKNSLLLTVGAGLLCLVLALLPAWWVTLYDFPGRRWLEWALVLPLAIPTYVAAFAYSDLLENLFPFFIWVRMNHGIEAFLLVQDLARYGLLMLVLASVLYPYVYITARASFSQQAMATLEAGRMLGKGGGGLFWRIGLPMARPAIAAGLALVTMEILNEFGAVSLFGVPTFTVGIFRAWLSLGDLDAARRLALCLMVFVAVALLLERAQRGRRRFADSALAARGMIRRRRLSGWRAWLMTTGCLVPLLFGFLLPGTRLLHWAVLAWERMANRELLVTAGRSVALAAGTSLLLLIAALVVIYAVRVHRTMLSRGLARVSGLGYAVPGAVVAVAVLAVTGFVDATWNQWRGAGDAGRVILSGSMAALVVAYLIRFLAVALQPIDSGFARLAGNVDEAARSLGARSSRVFWKVDLPLLRPAVVAAAILAFIDLLKELPLTLVLRPFDFETLATRAYSLAEEGRIQDCALPSLLLVAVSLCGLIPLTRLLGWRERAGAGSGAGSD